MNKIENKIHGCLVGGAVGDALGYPIEFIFSYREIASKYGGAVRDYDTSYSWLRADERNKVDLFSDDTQMTLYTAEGLLHAVANGAQILPAITQAYLAWYCGQRGMKHTGDLPSKLLAINELNQNRAPGNTCMSALSNLSNGKNPDNYSKGCGGIMRIAPIAAYGAAHGWDINHTAYLAGEAARITHKHPMSTLSSACCAAIIQLCILEDGEVDRERFDEIVVDALHYTEMAYPDEDCFEEFKGLMEKALSHTSDNKEDWQIIEKSCGEGWVAEETLAIALFSVARHLDSFEDCVVCAVNHGGDSDSTGAVAGNIIGAILGCDAIPARFTDNLQLLPLLHQFASALS